jgi:hypothetical protein
VTKLSFTEAYAEQCGGSEDDAFKMPTTQQLDTYLLALAVHHGVHLVSFDRRLSCGAVAGGRDALWLIDL